MYCFHCKYNLKHLTSEACPECGRSFDRDDPRTYLLQPVRPFPLLGAKTSAAMSSWAAKRDVLSILACMVMQLGIRMAGSMFMVMILLVAIVEGESGRRRTHWDNVVFLDLVILAGLYLSHALIPLLNTSGRRDPIRLWSYPAGVVLAVLIFFSPLRP